MNLNRQFSSLEENKIQAIFDEAIKDHYPDFIRCMKNNGCKNIASISLSETIFLVDNVLSPNPSWVHIRFGDALMTRLAIPCADQNFFIPYDFAFKVLILGHLPLG